MQVVLATKQGGHMEAAFLHQNTFEGFTLPGFFDRSPSNPLWQAFDTARLPDDVIAPSGAGLVTVDFDHRIVRHLHLSSADLDCRYDDWQFMDSAGYTRYRELFVEHRLKGFMRSMPAQKNGSELVVRALDDTGELMMTWHEFRNQVHAYLNEVAGSMLATPGWCAIAPAPGWGQHAMVRHRASRDSFSDCEAPWKRFVESLHHEGWNLKPSAPAWERFLAPYGLPASLMMDVVTRIEHEALEQSVPSVADRRASPRL